MSIPSPMALIIALLTLLPPALPGGAAAAEPSLSREPITIDADRMESRQKENAVSFSGHVEARQGDFAINADSITIYYSGGEGENASAGPPVARRIEKLVGKGNVELRRQGWSASGDSIEYFAQQGKVVLTGNTKVLRDNNLISGERIVIYLDEGKSVVESQPGNNGGRVKAIINPANLTGAQPDEGKPAEGK